MTTDIAYDVVTCGEGLLRLSPARYERLEQSNVLDVHVTDAHILHRRPLHVVERGLKAQNLLDRAGNERGVGNQFF